MKSYLIMMAVRLLEMRRLLKDTGSLYLHCDPTASHYLKLLLDAILGRDNYRNEIAWCYRKWSVAASQFVRNHDVILFYSRQTTLARPFNQIKFDGTYPNLVGLTTTGWEMDRQFLVELSKTAWDSVVTEFRRDLPDSVIEKAVRKLPST